MVLLSWYKVSYVAWGIIRVILCSSSLGFFMLSGSLEEEVMSPANELISYGVFRLEVWFVGGVQAGPRGKVHRNLPYLEIQHNFSLWAICRCFPVPRNI